MFRGWRIVTYLVLFSCICLENALAEIIFTAPPREDAARGKEIYQPIAKRLTAILGETVVYEQPTGWFDYARKMRKGEYDIVFDGPHFAAWRVKHLKHTPVASLPGSLRFVLVTDKERESIKSVNDLAGKKICGLASPNLGTDLIFESFRNPVLQPEIYDVKGGMKAVFKAYRQGRCAAAILRIPVYKKLPAEERSKLKVLLRTRPLPNQTITISTRLKKHEKKLADFMVSKQGSDAADLLLGRFSGKARYFVRSKEKDFQGVERLIEGVVYGW